MFKNIFTLGKTACVVLFTPRVPAGGNMRFPDSSVVASASDGFEEPSLVNIMYEGLKLLVNMLTAVMLISKHVWGEAAVQWSVTSDKTTCHSTLLCSSYFTASFIALSCRVSPSEPAEQGRHGDEAQQTDPEDSPCHTEGETPLTPSEQLVQQSQTDTRVCWRHGNTHKYPANSYYTCTRSDTHCR